MERRDFFKNMAGTAMAWAGCELRVDRLPVTGNNAVESRMHAQYEVREAVPG
jgi:hypothetical protein